MHYRNERENGEREVLVAIGGSFNGQFIDTYKRTSRINNPPKIDLEPTLIGADSADIRNDVMYIETYHKATFGNQKVMLIESLYSKMMHTDSARNLELILEELSKEPRYG